MQREPGTLYRGEGGVGLNSVSELLLVGTAKFTVFLHIYISKTSDNAVLQIAVQLQLISLKAEGMRD